jgi:carbon-monoxide dehydrogenase medium subunit
LRRSPLPDGANGAYRHLEQPASGYSLVGVAAVIARSGGQISHARIGVTGVHEHPYRAHAVEEALVGSDGSPTRIEEGARLVTDDVEVNSDIHADAEYRTAMAAIYTRRAIEAAIAAGA